MNYSCKKTVEDIDVYGKRVLLRCDFNVPFDTFGKISNTKRIDAALPTIKYLMQNAAKIIIISHLGRPKGLRKLEYSLKPVVAYLSQVLKANINFVDEDFREKTPEILNNLRNGEVAVLENIRFYKEEEQNDEEFSKQLAKLADIYINDAFGTSHRAHASTHGITRFLPSVCGFLIKKELEVLGQLLTSANRPFVAVIGGAKVSDKINVINNLLDKVDTLIVAGGMAYTFLNALGYSIGTSIFEADKVALAQDIMAKARDLGVKVMLPVDNVVGLRFEADTEHMIVNSDSIPDGFMGLDIGPKTRQIFSDVIKNAKTVLWNGPVGVFEWENFRTGTLKIAEAIADSTAVSVVGGGDSVSAVELLGFADKITHISTGGGASLAFLEGKDLPGISALNEK